MITQQNIRSILPGKVVRVVVLMAGRLGISNMAALRRFYASETYRKLECEESKYWWMSPEQLCAAALADMHLTT